MNNIIKIVLGVGAASTITLTSINDTSPKNIPQQKQIVPVVMKREIDTPKKKIFVEKKMKKSKKIPIHIPKKVTPNTNCHPSYSGCLKQGVGDYDCSGGSGNGPNYTGKVRVFGYDEFRLDRDHDGWGCE